MWIHRDTINETLFMNENLVINWNYIGWICFKLRFKSEIDFVDDINYGVIEWNYFGVGVWWKNEYL